MTYAPRGLPTPQPNVLSDETRPNSLRGETRPNTLAGETLPNTLTDMASTPAADARSTSRPSAPRLPRWVIIAIGVAIVVVAVLWLLGSI